MKITYQKAVELLKQFAAVEPLEEIGASYYVKCKYCTSKSQYGDKIYKHNKQCPWKITVNNLED